MLEEIDNYSPEKDKSSVEDIDKRKFVRYIRKDLKSYLTKYYFCKFGKPIKTKLVNISSGGVQVSTSRNLRINKKLSVNISFSDGFLFEIKGKIVNRKKKYTYVYDLAFDSIDNVIDKQNSTIARVFVYYSSSLIKSIYRNVTSNGMQILTNKKLDTNNEVTLKFQFHNEETYTINAKLIRYSKEIRNYYGIEFENPDSALGNYLLKTQQHLNFG